MRIGVIGGSGVYAMDGLENVREERISTPFGDPSDAVILGSLGGIDMAFLPRHGRGHRFNPSEVNYRANIFALKTLGVEWCISVSAVGSLKEQIVPGHVVVIDQFIDKTHQRKATFFEQGLVAHVAFGDPVCGELRKILLAAACEAGATVHDGGTYVCMEGPAFSSKAESLLHRSWGASVIGMTNMPEAKLAREAEMSYATLAMATDYDCWHPDHDHVTVEQVVAVLLKNASLARDIVAKAAPKIAAFGGPAPCSNALATAILTHKEAVPMSRKRDLAPILGKYMPA
ncbi:MAG: S-methyl-5'-thioadenosine phosphorylase [Deltaproteobacteria bacterium]|nr:S-methyl-5'-thioadenosine phosphorylase [Deltaproteobacteria bacterium]